MNCLYLLGNYPKLSETYIATEIDFMVRSGVEVQVYSPAGGCPGGVARVPVHRGTFGKAVSEFKPDLLHSHYLVLHHKEIEEAGRMGLPVTVRGHSFDFSFQNFKRMIDLPAVRKVYLFPHFGTMLPGTFPKIKLLPVAFDPGPYYSEPKDRRLVFRTAAGKSNKGLFDFLEVAKLCPNHRFFLAVDPVDPEFMHRLRERAHKTAVTLLEQASNDLCAKTMRKAGIYLSTSDPAGHPFGMPVSIAEALSSGCYVLAREVTSATTYLGRAGAFYGSVQEAAERIRASDAWSNEHWDMVAGEAMQQAKEFHADRVLPHLLSDWREITGKTP